MVDPGVVLEPHLGEPEVRPLPGVPGHDVVDDAPAVGVRDVAQRTELLLGAERRVDLGADAVEMPVDARGLEPSGDSARALHRAGVHGGDPDALERRPQLLVARAPPGTTAPAG